MDSMTVSGLDSLWLALGQECTGHPAQTAELQLQIGGQEYRAVLLRQWDGWVYSLFDAAGQVLPVEPQAYSLQDAAAAVLLHLQEFIRGAA